MAENSSYWNQPSDNYSGNYYETDYNQFQNQPFEFKPLEEYNNELPNPDYSQMYNPNSFSKVVDNDAEEPTLLEELEIYPDRILQKSIAVLNPFKSHGLTDDSDYLTKDPDLAGPISFYLLLAVSLFWSGNKADFGYIYGISVLSCLMMYCLLSLMTFKGDLFSLTIVASILGYCIIPIVGLALLGVILSLKGPLGIVLAILAVFWSSLSASRLFVAVSGDKEQQPLTAYPCALVSGVYALLVIF